MLSGAGLKAAPWLRLREDAVVMEERQAPRCSTPVTLPRLPRGRALLTAFQTPRAASSSSSGKRGCAHLPAEGSVPPGQSQSSPMFHTRAEQRGLMLQNRGSGSWPRGTSCFVLITAVLREEAQASPLHPPYTHSAAHSAVVLAPGHSWPRLPVVWELLYVHHKHQGTHTSLTPIPQTVQQGLSLRG